MTRLLGANYFVKHGMEPAAWNHPVRDEHRLSRLTGDGSCDAPKQKPDRVFHAASACTFALFILTGFAASEVFAQDDDRGALFGQDDQSSLTTPQDTLKRLDQQHGGKDKLFDVPALGRFYKNLDAAREKLHDETGFKAVAFHSTVYQYASDTLPGQDDSGIATISALMGTWDVVDKSDPTRGQFSFDIEARWGYGNNLTPVELGFAGIGSATGTVDPYGETSPKVVMREAFWHQGAPEDGWNYRIGKITPDRMLTSSNHIDPVQLFFPVGSGGAPSIAFPDSGFGAGVGFFPTKKFRFGILASDAAGNRADRGDIGQGNFFTAIEVQYQFWPLTENGGYSTFTLWHNDGTDDPSDASDSSTGEEGWGYFIKLEQELTDDGKDIAIIRFGKSFDGSAQYEEQGSIRYVRQDPPDPFGLRDDQFGIAMSYVKPIVDPFNRDEWGLDTFYRFNLLNRVQFSLGYQVIFDPSFNPDEDTINIFSLRLTQFF